MEIQRSDFSRPPTPTSYGEVPSASSTVTQNMPNAASDIVRPSFNPLNYHLSESRIMNGSFCVCRLSRWNDSSVGLARGPRSPPQRPVPAGTGRWGVFVGVPLPLARGRRTSVLAHDLKSPPPTDTGWDGS